LKEADNEVVAAMCPFVVVDGYCEGIQVHWHVAVELDIDKIELGL
jgi:hypothetical protein